MICKCCGRELKGNRYPRYYGFVVCVEPAVITEVIEVLCWTCFAWSAFGTSAFGHLYQARK